jgi:hypothetical protein
MVTVEIFDPASTRKTTHFHQFVQPLNISARAAQKTPFLCSNAVVAVETRLFAKPLLSTAVL